VRRRPSENEPTPATPVASFAWCPAMPPNGSRLSCGRPAAGRKVVDEQSVPLGHNPPLPLERLSPVSFKRLLGSAFERATFTD